MNNSNLMPPWKKGQSGNPKGRPRNRVRTELNKVLTKEQLRDFQLLSADERKDWDNTLRSLPFTALKVIAESNVLPVYAKAIATAIIKEGAKGKTDVLDKLTDRVDGKTVQKVELTGNDGGALQMQVGELSDEELDKQIKELQRKLN